MSSQLSIIIPSRQPVYLQKTIDDLLGKAEGEVQVVVVFDGRWPMEAEVPMINDHPKVVVVHQGTVHNSFGMRAAINTGVAIATGDYVMKCDEHVMWDQGYDTKLKTDCESNWVVIPRRYRLDADNWVRSGPPEDMRPPIDYMHIDYPYQRPNDKTCGLHGAEWRQRYYDRKDVLIDDTPSMQGSCYFMTHKHWDTVIKELDEEMYGPFTQEPQEIGLKTWFTGGRVVVNKKTWYAHYHKGNKGKGYGFSNEQYRRHAIGNERGRLSSIACWLYTKEYAPFDWDWFMQKFPDMPGWGTDWKERIEKDKELDYSKSPSYQGR